MKAARTAAFLAAAAAAALAGDGGNPDDFETRQDRRPTFETHGDVLLSGATVLTVTRGTVENGSVLVRGGKIAAIGVDLEVPEGVPVLDCSGLFVMPGIIDCHAHIAIDGGVNEGSQSVVPEVRIADEVDPHDVAIYRALAGGTTTANLLHGSANVVGGQNAVVKLRYETTPEEMLSKARAWIAANPSAKQPWDVQGYKIPGGTPSSPNVAQMLAIAPSVLRDKTKGCFPAPEKIMCAAVEGAQVDFDTAQIIEARYFTELTTGQVAKNMIGTFWFQLNEINAGSSRPQGFPQYVTKKVGVPTTPYRRPRCLTSFKPSIMA